MSWRKRAIAGLAALAVAGVIAVAGGYNVSAEAGHLPWMRTLFVWTLNNSVFWRSLGETPPGAMARAAMARTAPGRHQETCP